MAETTPQSADTQQNNLGNMMDMLQTLFRPQPTHDNRCNREERNEDSESSHHSEKPDSEEWDALLRLLESHEQLCDAFSQLLNRRLE